MDDMQEIEDVKNDNMIAHGRRMWEFGAEIGKRVVECGYITDIAERAACYSSSIAFETERRAEYESRLLTEAELEKERWIRDHQEEPIGMRVVLGGDVYYSAVAEDGTLMLAPAVMPLELENTMTTNITNVVATRVMKYSRSDGVELPVTVYIGDLNYVAPVTLDSEADNEPRKKDPSLNEVADFTYVDKEEAGHWEASVQIIGPGMYDGVRKLYGADSIQALYHAMAIAGSQLTFYSLNAQLDFSKLPNYGFPAIESALEFPAAI